MTAPVTAAPAPATASGTPLTKLALRRAKPLFTEVADKTGRRVATGLRPNGSQTGSWTYNRASRGGPRHEITLDPNAHKGITQPPPRRGTAEWYLACFVAILRHECHHALHTERDLFRLNRECAAHGVPFVSLNIGEDIRIDTIARVTHGRYGWSRWYAPAAHASTAEPLAWLCWGKMVETPRPDAYVTWTGVKEAERIRLGKPDGKGKRNVVREILPEFYQDCAAAKSTSEIVTLMRDLFLTFPSAQRDVTKIPGLPSGIVGHGYGGADKDSGTASHKDDVVAVGTAESEVQEDRSTAVSPERFMGGMAHLPDAEIEKVTGVSVATRMAKAKKVAERLARLLGATGGQPSQTASFGSRLHVPNAAYGSAQSFRVSGKRRGERPKVVALFDQSGSMGPDWVNHGAAFCAALLLLTRMGRIDAQVIVTGGGAHSVLPPNFPVERVSRFTASKSCESVAGTLNANKRLVQSADIVLIYTDANLTDGVVDAGKWRSHGVDLIGAAVAHEGYDEESKRKMMTRHFHRAILARDGEALATKIAQYIATK